MIVVAPQPTPHGPREREVVHHPVPAVAPELAGGVVAVLADEVGIRPSSGHRASHGHGGVVVGVDVAQSPGHVGDIDPPAVEVERWAQPGRGHRVGPAQQPALQFGVAQVELRQCRDVEPRLVLVGVVSEEVEPGFGRRRVGLRARNHS